MRRQEADGSWGGIQPPWVYSLMALHLGGYPLEHAVMRRGLEGLERFMVEDRGGAGFESRPPGVSDVSGSEPHPVDCRKTRTPLTRRPDPSPAPRWVRAPLTQRQQIRTPPAEPAPGSVPVPGVGHGARDGGARRRGPHVRAPGAARAAEWLLDEEVRVRGDWAVVRPELEPGGWAFEFENDNYPDVDDTAEVVLALLGVTPLEPELVRRANRHRRRIGDLPPAQGDQGVRERTQDAIDRAVAWVEGMQSADGGWGAFDVDNTRALVRELPFLDFGEVIDAPSADVTAHALEMLAAVGRADSEAARAGSRWLLGQQEADGSWFGRWGINHVYGTGAAVPALVAVGMSPQDPRIRRAVRVAAGAPERGRRLGGGPALLRRSSVDRTWPLDCLADGVGAAGAARRGRADRDRPGGGARSRVARVHAARRRNVGRAAVHGHRVPVRLLHQLPPLPPDLPDHGARPLWTRRWIATCRLDRATSTAFASPRVAQLGPQEP